MTHATRTKADIHAKDAPKGFEKGARFSKCNWGWLEYGTVIEAPSLAIGFWTIVVRWDDTGLVQRRTVAGLATVE
jgi:hypothetical protein